MQDVQSFKTLARICRGRCVFTWAVLLSWAIIQPAFAAIQVAVLSPGQPWQRMEFRVLGVPAANNPFDPDVIRVDGEFRFPTGEIRKVPGFWYQEYTRQLSGTSEVLSLATLPEWRVRFAPPAVGSYTLIVSVQTNGIACGDPVTNSFTVAGAVPARTGYARIAPGKSFFETGDGQALPLIGANVCWHGSRGTYDYDDWFASFQTAGANFARLWMCPWSFGLETESGALNRFRLDRAWQLDYVLRLAEQRGIYLELCLDYHGMFAVEPDYWGGNNYWKSNPYNVTNGGPCINPNAFFTNSIAQTTYQKRLRYLIARYGYSPSILSWQFFNEIDNVSSLVNTTDVASWHRKMGSWMRTNDSFGHLLTTSFTSVEPHPEMWNLPQIDYVCVHSYGPARPAAAFSTLTQTLRQKYGKPVLIDEFGTSWQGWNRAGDFYLRGFRQGLWGGALSGSVGTAMSWWWQNIHSENLYPTYSALSSFLNKTGWGRGAWTNLQFHALINPPETVGDALPGGSPFSISLPLSTGWGTMLTGKLAVPNPTASANAASALNSFVHGTSHADLRIPFQISAWFTNNARLILHVNSVSWNSILSVRSDGVELYRTNFPNLDGGWSVTNEYNLDISVNIPSGKRLLEIVNLGSDWFYLDWVRLEQVIPAQYTNGWQPPCEPIGLGGPREALLYVVAPGAAFPGNATNSNLPLQTGQTITLTNWPGGDYVAHWYDPETAAPAGTSRSSTTNGALTLQLPAFSSDLAGILYHPPKLASPHVNSGGVFAFNFESETSGIYDIETSSNLTQWVKFRGLTNTTGSQMVTDTSPAKAASRYFRARQQP